MPGGKATTGKVDAHKIAVLLRGGMFPQAYVDPSEMCATVIYSVVAVTWHGSALNC